jgi:thioredoxin-related protein
VPGPDRGFQSASCLKEVNHLCNKIKLQLQQNEHLQEVLKIKNFNRDYILDSTERDTLLFEAKGKTCLAKIIETTTNSCRKFAKTVSERPKELRNQRGTKEALPLGSSALLLAWVRGGILC